MSDPNIRHFKDKIDQCERIMESTRNVWDKPFEALGAFATGRSNRPASLDRMVDAENRRKSSAFDRYQKAAKDLKFWQERLRLYEAGEVHANGQPRADAPSRKKAQRGSELIGEYFRATLKPGDRVAVAMNPRNTIEVKRVNRKSITCEGGSKWGWDEITPLINEVAMTEKQFRQALREFFEESHA